MKKLFSLFASLSILAPSTAFATAPVHALPIWAEFVADSHCSYLRMGATWDQAMAQALRDRSHWIGEISAAGGLGSKAIVYAIALECKDLNEKAFSEKERVGRITGTI